MIKLEHLSKTYNKGKSNELKVTNDISLSLPDKGLITFLGQSGSGKTTLLNIIGGLDKSDSGTLIYDDNIFDKYKMKDIDAYRSRNIGYIFQNYNLLNDLTVYDNLKVALDIIGVTDEEEASKRIEYTLKAVGLFKYRKKLAANLSGGQQQRVSIARALLKNAKIIIADEPTGNLDHNNSVEIMNILKRISENTLVLLVTHDRKLADIYSDQIIEISDGKILSNTSATNAEGTTLGKSESEVYLLDLKKLESGNRLHSTLYTTDENDEIALTIVNHNGTYYLEANKPIKLLKDSNLELKNEHFEEKKLDLSEFSYDTSWYDNSYAPKLHLFSQIKLELKSFINTRRRQKFFHIVFFVLGILLAIINILFMQTKHLDLSRVNTERDAYIFEDTLDLNELEAKEFLLKGIETGAIDNLYSSDYINLSFTRRLNSIETKHYNDQITRYSIELIDDYPLISGTLPTKFNEIVLGKSLANTICNKLELTYDELIGYESTGDSFSNYQTMKIVGISSKDTNQVYTCNQKIIEAIDGTFMDVYVYEFEENNIQIVAGVGATEPNTVMYKSGSYNSLTELPYAVGDVDEEGNTVSGLFIPAIDGYSVKKIYSSAIQSSWKSDVLSIMPYYDNMLNIIEGRTPNNENEIVTSCYSSYQIDDEVVLGGETFKVVGKTDTYNFVPMGYVLQKAYGKLLISYSQNDYSFCSGVYFTIHNKEAIKTLASNYDFTICTRYDVQKQVAVDTSIQDKLIYIPIMVVISAVVVIYIYFTMRSKMIVEIYDIGVYRSLGQSRSKILVKHVIAIAILSTLTAMLGYIITTLVYAFVWSKLHEFTNALVNPWTSLSTYVVVVLFYCAAILIGLIPIMNLLRKTPSEIISKYDI